MTRDRGDRAGQCALKDKLAEFHRDAFVWALNCCRHNRDDAEDILQATYLKILEGRARFDGRSSFITWLFAVVRLTAVDHRRRHFLRNLLAARWVDEESNRLPEPGADSATESAQRCTVMKDALASLPMRQREVLLLVFYHEFSIEDAARVMAVSVGSARQHYARGKRALRTKLTDRRAEL